MKMILTVFWVIYCVLFSKLAGGDELQPALMKEIHNVFNNLSNLALMPHLMETSDCRRDSQVYNDALFNNEIWAAKIYDAGGRTIPGILKGNTFQMGSLDGCVGVSSEMSKISRQFCWVKVFIRSKQKDNIVDKIWSEVYRNPLFVSKPYENNIFPTNDVFLASLCVPSSCTISELERATKRILSVFNESRYQMEVHVDNMNSQSCVTTEEHSSEPLIIYLIRIIVIAKMIVVPIATLIDVWMLQNIQTEPRDFVTAFLKSYSLKQNGKVLFNVEKGNENVASLNGMRCIAYLLLFAFHYSLRYLVFAVNRSESFEFIRSSLSIPLIAATPLILDMLIFLSGICHSYKLSSLAAQNKQGAIFKSFFFRYLRFLLFIMTFVYLGIPSLKINKHLLLYSPRKINPDIWAILFCYENFHGIFNMLFPPAHTFYTDIQLYAIACVILIAIKSMKKKFRVFLALIFLTLICRSLINYFNPDIPVSLSFGIPLDKFAKMYTLIYSTPFGRLPIYVAGMALGYYARENVGKQSNLSTFYIKAGLVIASLYLCVTLFTFDSYDDNNVYSSFNVAVLSFMNTSCALIFGSSLVWYCFEFRNSPIAKFLSSNTFVILNRLVPYFSILHLLILAYSIGKKYSLFDVSPFEILGLDYLVWCILASMFVMLFIHLPSQNLVKYFYNRIGKEIKRS